MTITVPTEVPSQITVPDWMVTAGKAYLVYVGIIGLFAIVFTVFVAYQFFRGFARMNRRLR